MSWINALARMWCGRVCTCVLKCSLSLTQSVAMNLRKGRGERVSEVKTHRECVLLFVKNDSLFNFVLAWLVPQNSSLSPSFSLWKRLCCCCRCCTHSWPRSCSEHFVDLQNTEADWNVSLVVTRHLSCQLGRKRGFKQPKKIQGHVKWTIFTIWIKRGERVSANLPIIRYMLAIC